MRYNLKKPNSFPDKNEELFLSLLLSEQSDFLNLWQEWKSKIRFDDMDHATLRLIPLLYLRLKDFDINDEIIGRIKGTYKLVWVKNQRLLSTTQSVVSMLENHDIKVLLLKGIPLLIDVYKDTGSRFLSDVDIFIHPNDIKKAIKVMNQHGWIYKTNQFPDIDIFSDEQLSRIVKEITFINNQRMEIDMHWRIFEYKGGKKNKDIMPFDQMWEYSNKIYHKNSCYRTLCPEDLLIHIIVHGAEGSTIKSLRFVIDSVYVIKNYKIDWNLFIKKTQQYNFNADIYIAFNYMQDKGFIQLPDKIIKSILNIPLSKKMLKDYYRKSDTIHQPFGGFFRLWRNYWHFESKSYSLVGLYYFVEYFRKALGINSKRDLFIFIANKYKTRLLYYKNKLFSNRFYR